MPDTRSPGAIKLVLFAAAVLLLVMLTTTGVFDDLFHAIGPFVDDLLHALNHE